MKLVRYGAKGAEKPGLIDKSGQLRDLSAHVRDLDGEAYAPASLAKLAALDTSKLPAVDGKQRFGAPVTGISKFVAIGLNYSRPCQGNRLADTRPSRSSSSRPTPRCRARTTRWKSRAAPPSSTGKSRSPPSSAPAPSMSREADALNHLAGYCVCNDVSERNFQQERGGQWTKGKSHDTFGPLGLWLVTKDEIPDVQKLGDVARRQRPAPPNRQHLDHDLLDGEVHFLRLAVHDAVARRHRHDRHPARRRFSV